MVEKYFYLSGWISDTPLFYLAFNFTKNCAQTMKSTYFYLGTTVFLCVIALVLFKASIPVNYVRGGEALIPAALAPKVLHLSTPESLKGIYMTSCVASLPSWRSRVVSLIEETELNAVVVDIKDYTGTISTDNSSLGTGCKIPDISDFIKELHDKNIYVIGRVTVFQDPTFTKLHPDLAVKRKSDGEVWKDRKGLAFIDVGAREYWDYIVKLSKSAEKMGFDEINYDYIRFPSDGDMTNITFTHTGTTTKREMLRQFFEYLDSNLKDTPLKTSADLFGMVTTNTDDLGIGQVLENALPYFDYISPMIYPSHYPANFNGWPDPNKVPYELIKFVMDSAVKKTEALASTSRANLLSTTTPSSLAKRNVERINKFQLRPWLQDNDYPIHYTSAMVRAQIQATYDSGLTSWMLWDPSNTYTQEALELDAVPAHP